jgi:6-phosphofructokinase 1
MVLFMTKTIGVLTSGGDSPGMNAALRAVVRTALYHGHNIYGIRKGFEGLINDDIIEMNASSVSNIIKDGGTMLLTARSQDFFTKQGRDIAYNNLQKHGIQSLIVIGGDGSFQGLHKLLTEHQIQAIGIPGTIDNDLYGTDYTIGFDTAVNTALQAIDKIRDTATSHSRLFIIEVMGRNAGYIGLYTGISGGAEEILIPETDSNIQQVCNHLKQGVKRGKNSSIIVVSEGDEAGNAFELKEKIQNLINWEVRVSILGHQQRGGSPTAFDRILASRLGYEAIQAINNDHSDIMIGVVNDTITYTSLEDTWTKKKGINYQLITMASILSS